MASKSAQSKLTRLLYAKGGAAVEESRRLLSSPAAQAIPLGGPDLFLLSVNRMMDANGVLLLTSIGHEAKAGQHSRGKAIEYDARPLNGQALQRRWRYANALCQVVRDALSFKPQLILSGVEGPFAAAYYLAARLLSCKFVLLVHVAPDQPSLSRLTRLLNRFVAKRAQAVVVHGPYLKACVAALGVPESRIIEFDTGVDIPEAAQLAINQPNPATPTFVFAGRIEADKGVFDLLEAFALFRLKHPGRLIFFGEGGASEALGEAARQHPNSADIDLHGKASQREVFSAISHASAAVTPTRSSFPEGRCMTALESIALGTPVIAPEFGPFPYAVQHGVNGLLYRPDDVEDLAIQMCRMTSAPDSAEVLKASTLRSASQKKPFRSFYTAVCEATNFVQLAK